MLNLIRTSIFLSIILLAISPRESRAAACCTSAAAFGTGRLLIWESFAVGLKSSFVSEIVDDHGDWRPGSGTSQYEWRNDAWGIVGLTDRISVFAVVPWVIPMHQETEKLEYGYGLGDLQTGGRYQLINIGEYAELPSLALIGTLIFPTGTPSGGADPVTGRGVWGGAFGISLEKTWMPWYLQLNLGAALPFSTVKALNRSYGPSAQVGLALGVELPYDVVVSLVGQWSFEGEWYQNDFKLDKEGYKTTLTLASSWRFHPNFTLQASLSSDIFIEPISYRLPGNIVTNLGIRYGFF